MKVWKPEKPLREYSIAELDLVRRRAELTPKDVDAVETAITALSVIQGRRCPWLHRDFESFVELDGQAWSQHGKERREAYSKEVSRPK